MYTALWPDSSANFEAVEGKTYKVYFDGVPYICVAKLFASLLIIGNSGLLGGEDTGEPFIIIKNGSEWVIVTTDTSPSHVLSISGMVNEIKQIDSKYLPIASDDEYGVVKRSEIITSYVFPNATVGVSQMKKAIDDFNNGSARIKWGGDIVISASYEDDGTLYIVFSSQPYRTMSMTSDTTYQKNLLTQVSLSEGIMGRLRISSSDSQNVESVIDCHGSSYSDRTISIDAEHFDLVSADLRMLNKVILNRKELILQSSTDSSTKKFKITVDDSGRNKSN